MSAKTASGCDPAERLVSRLLDRVVRPADMDTSPSARDNAGPGGPRPEHVRIRNYRGFAGNGEPTLPPIRLHFKTSTGFVEPGNRRTQRAETAVAPGHDHPGITGVGAIPAFRPGRVATLSRVTAARLEKIRIRQTPLSLVLSSGPRLCTGLF